MVYSPPGSAGGISGSQYPAAVRRGMQRLADNVNNSGDIVSGGSSRFCRVWQVQSPSAANATNYTLVWQQALQSADGFIPDPTMTPGSTITIPTGLAGMYAIEGAVYWQPISPPGSQLSTEVHIRFLVNGSPIVTIVGSSPKDFGAHHLGRHLLQLSAGDTVQMQVYQNSGGTVVFVGSLLSDTWFSLAYLGQGP